MAFPTLGTPALTETLPNSTAHAVNLPTERTVGRLLLLFLQNSDSELPAGLTGWTQLYSSFLLGWRGLYARIVTGDEPSQLALTTTIAGRVASICVEVSGLSGSSIGGSVSVAGFNYLSSAAMPRLSPTGVATASGADTLWLAAYMCDSTATLIDAPSGYGLIAERPAIFTSSCSLWLYGRALAAPSEQPGPWNLSTLRAASTLTVALSSGGSSAAPKTSYYQMLRRA